MVEPQFYTVLHFERCEWRSVVRTQCDSLCGLTKISISTEVLLSFIIWLANTCQEKAECSLSKDFDESSFCQWRESWPCVWVMWPCITFCVSHGWGEKTGGGWARMRWRWQTRRKSREDAIPTTSDLQVPEELESNFKNKLAGLCDLSGTAAAGIYGNRHELEFKRGHFRF